MNSDQHNHSSTVQPVNEQVAIKSSQLIVRTFGRDEIDPEFIDQWLELEKNALEANAFHSPHFIIPLLQHVMPDENPIFVAVYLRNSEKDKLVGLGIFLVHGNKDCPSYPRKHKASFYCLDHCYLGGLMIDSSCPDVTIEAIFNYFREHSKQWGSVLFQDIPGDGEIFALMSQSKALVGSWTGLREVKRAYLPIAESGEDYINRQLSSKKRADLRRLRRRLGEQGELEWRCLVGKQVDSCHIDDFLKLEHAGWKSDKGSSLLSHEADTRFFTDTVQRFAASDRALFTELRLSGKTIASTCNFISGNAAFAYKLGWDPAYSKFSPSILNLISLTENIQNHCSQLEYFDSGSVEGSFIDKLWKDRRILVNGFFSFSRSANFLLTGTQLTKRLLGKTAVDSTGD